MDAQGNIYVSDKNNFAIRKIDAQTKLVTTLTGPNLRVGSLYGISVNPSGSQIFVVESIRIRKIENGKISTLAGSIPGGYQDGKGEQALFEDPLAVQWNQRNSVIVADSDNSVIREVFMDGTVHSIAGNERYSYLNCLEAVCPARRGEGIGEEAIFDRPTNLATTQDGSIFVGDTCTISKLHFVPPSK